MGSGKIYLQAILAIYVFTIIGPIKCEDHQYVKWFNSSENISIKSEAIKSDNFFATADNSKKSEICTEAWVYVQCSNKDHPSNPIFTLTAHNFSISNVSASIPGILCTTNPRVAVAQLEGTEGMTAFLQKVN